MTPAPDGAYYWGYWLPADPVKEPAPRESVKGEDSSHAALTVAFPIMLAREGLSFASLRQSVYHRSLALSTRHLEIAYSPLGDQAGVVGAGVLAMHETLKSRGVIPS